MKTYILLVVSWLCLCPLQAQQIVEKHMSFSGKDALTLKIQIADSINILTWNKDEVYVKASVNINDNKDNAAYVTSFDDSGNSIVVKANFQDKYFQGKKNCCNESSIYWEVYMPENKRFSVETIDGNITVRGKTKEMNVKSISGFIDLAVPSSKQADLDFSTISGRMYSNLDISGKKSHSGIPMKVSEKLNSGGDVIKLETISGDIFLRKSN